MGFYWVYHIIIIMSLFYDMTVYGFFWVYHIIIIISLFYDINKYDFIGFTTL